MSVAGCSGGGKDSQQPAKKPEPTAAVAKQDIKPVMAPEEQKKPEYQVTGIRDPFLSFEKPLTKEDLKTMADPLQKISLSQIYLVGVIMGKDKRALIQESSGMGFIIKEGTLVGENSGIVTGIRPDGVTIRQHFKDYMGRVNTREVVLSLKKEEGVTGK
ncbi:MAG TPA: pilus assembly protein PilP [Deltaproteobacteria bacterium]|nr:pilus assembly protein PilP [Deltaproteobacteria bacterium]HOI05956.1 pilus assembly protein PilP [Deltaproteobacteria bacterium]